jgi:hypothetical protein
MTVERARQTLLGHAFILDDLSDPLMQNGFSYSLRPFKGLKREACLSVDECVRVLAPQLAGDFIARDIVSALWNILWMTRNWALSPRGMLQRNNLISADEVAWLDAWAARLDEAVNALLDGAGVETIDSILAEQLELE